MYLQFTLSNARPIISRIRRLANLLANNIGWGLLVDDEGGHLAQAVNGFLLDPVDEVLACWDIVDEADDLAGCPDLHENISTTV